MEYFNNSQNKETMYQEDMNFQNNCDMERKIDRFTFQQIELFIQQQVIHNYLVSNPCPCYYFRICIS